VSLLGTSFFNQALLSLRRHTSEISRLNREAATGKRLNRLSDDPAAGSRLLTLANEARRLENSLANIAEVKSSLSLATDALQNVSSALTRAQTLLSQALGGTYSDDNRAIIAEEINSILEQTLSLANSERLSVHLFAGKNTLESPFVVQRENGRIVSVQYVGTERANQLSFGSDVIYPLTFNGAEIFSADSAGVPVLLGNTGAAVGAGASSVIGDLILSVSHSSTTYLGASGVAAGASSASADTALGAHTLTIDDVASTIQLDGGPVVSYAGTETDLVLANENGDTVRVNVTGIVPGFQGQISLQSDGELSIDGGASSIPIDGSANQPVVDSRSGRVLFVDSSSVVRTGSESAYVPGARDLFNTLIHIRDILAGELDLDTQTRTDLLGQGFESLRDLSASLVGSLSRIGSRLQGLESIETAFTGVAQSNQDERSRIESADIIAVAAELAERTTLYQLTLESIGRITDLSLLNFLR